MCAAKDELLKSTNGVILETQQAAWAQKLKEIEFLVKQTVFRSAVELEEHFEQAHRAVVGHRCLFSPCDVVSASWADLMLHTTTHTEDLKPYICTCDVGAGKVCHFRCATRGDLEYHIAAAHRIHVAQSIRPRHKTRVPFERPSGIPRLIDRENRRELDTLNRELQQSAKAKKEEICAAHSVIFPFSQSTCVVPSLSTSLMADSGAFDECVPPLLIPIVPAAFSAELHSESYDYARLQYPGNPVRRAHGVVCPRNEERTDAHYPYHKQLVFPAKPLCHPLMLDRHVQIKERFHLCRERVEAFCRQHPAWYRAKEEQRRERSEEVEEETEEEEEAEDITCFGKVPEMSCDFRNNRAYSELVGRALVKQKKGDSEDVDML